MLLGRGCDFLMVVWAAFSLAVKLLLIEFICSSDLLAEEVEFLENDEFKQKFWRWRGL